MTTFFMTLYLLVWPVIVFGVMTIIARAFFKDWVEARRNGEDII